MRTAAALLLAIGTAGAGFVLARLLSDSAPDGLVEHRADNSAPRIQTINPPVSSEPPTLEMPDSRAPVLTERPPDPAPPVPPADAAKQVTAPDPSDPRTLPESTLAEMQNKRDAIQAFLLQRTTPLLMKRLDDGLAKLVEVGDTWTSPDYEQMRTTIHAVRSEPGQGWYRAVLPREEYPELYVYKDEVYRLENAVLERERAAAQAKWEEAQRPR